MTHLSHLQYLVVLAHVHRNQLYQNVVVVAMFVAVFVAVIDIAGWIVAVFELSGVLLR